MVSFSVLIITHGREDLLLKCLDSLRPPVESWQLIIVANGLPLSAPVLTLAQSLTPELEVLNLEKKETPGKSRNEGLKLVKNEWVFLIDDDAYVYPKYFETVLPLLSQSRIDVLGGPDAPAKGMDNFSQALAITLASPLCTGKTFSRHISQGKQMIPANEEILTSCNLWIRSHFLREMHFPENYLRTEETALLLDLENQGAHMFYHPGLVVAHHRRKDLKSLIKPTFYAGYYRSKVLREKVHRKVGYFWLPAIFVLLHLVIFLSLPIFWSLTRVYLGIIVMMSLNLTARRQKMGLFLYVSFLHYFIVVVYGLGFMANRLGFHENK
ncbi:MAG: glycosyltransferase [Bdellovibrionales bacterium]|nr:glycosyltransferase [Bdellovibrionales bacterium]